MPTGPRTIRMKAQLADAKLYTICQEGLCPNLGECFEMGVATFMILGDRCTRACAYCLVDTRKPRPVDPDEPRRLAELAQELDLEHVVITSVNRDDQQDGGAIQFQRVIEALRKCSPEMRIEVLIPDFEGNRDALHSVVDAGPDILNHNLEVVRRLYPQLRPQGAYDWAIELLDRVKQRRPDMTTKSGLIAGIGESMDELLEAMTDLRAVDCDILTIGQYLQPSPKHAPIARFMPPEEFDRLRDAGLEMGFRYVESGPLVRSSYHAAQQQV